MKGKLNGRKKFLIQNDCKSRFDISIEYVTLLSTRKTLNPLLSSIRKSFWYYLLYFLFGFFMQFLFICYYIENICRGVVARDVRALYCIPRKPQVRILHREIEYGSYNVI